MIHYENKSYAINIPSAYQQSTNEDPNKVQKNRKRGAVEFKLLFVRYGKAV